MCARGKKVEIYNERNFIYLKISHVQGQGRKRCYKNCNGWTEIDDKDKKVRFFF